jgi:hypothetical protein
MVIDSYLIRKVILSPYATAQGAMVSPAFLKKLSSIIDKSHKPVLLWVFNTPAPQMAGIR